MVRANKLILPEQITEHFTLSEFTNSATAAKRHISNSPNIEQYTALKYGCDMILEPLRRLIKRPIHITSGFRCEKLNTAVGGVKDSYHMKGQAVDIHVSSEKDAQEMWSALKKLPSVDKALFEHSNGARWLHVQWRITESPRHYFNWNYNV